MENPSLAFVGLDVETRAKDSVANALSKMKEVRFVSSLVGRHDLMVFILAEDVTKLSKVLYEEISSHHIIYGLRGFGAKAVMIR